MTAPATIDAGRVQALSRLIREKTGRVETDAAPGFSQRKNLWLQLPPAEPRSGKRRAGGGRRAASRGAAGNASPTRLATRIRRPLSLLLSAVVLLATAATAVDLFTAQGSLTQHAIIEAPGAPARTLPEPSLTPGVEASALQQENQRLRERLQALERALAGEAH